MSSVRRLVILIAFSLAACSEPEVLLEDERLDVDGNPIKVQSEDRSVPLSLPRASVNPDWTHAGGNVRHQLSNLAVDRELNLAWSVDIGEGNSRRFRIAADPVVSGGRIFVMDSRSLVSAFSTSGELIWSTGITPPGDRSDEATGGGLAVSGNTLYVTSGFGTLTALDATSGAVRWSHDFDAAATGAPTVSDGVVYAL
ncbi:MAG: PQQ-binding-like beta-propeller repeat protein, partial [Paracoccaceae bacterium]|nr:PQQ-binding-like beta-propeller repeat protein [Paracoccaceae bacterium]